MGNLKHNKYIGWIIFIFTIFAGYLLSTVENYNTIYLVYIILLLLCTIVFRNSFDKNILISARTILGLLFIFSGFVKGVDPVGTQYRIEDYFIAFGTEWAWDLALPLSVFLNMWEFALGAFLLFNIRIKYTSWFVLLTMMFFTIVTFNDALYNPVPDCGCFGDALVISNWQTFYKNLVIDILILIVLFNHQKNTQSFTLKTEYILAGIFVLAFTFFEIYNVRHLPVLDFRAWKVGSKMAHENPLPKKYYLTYKNTTSGEEKEYLSPDYPYDDSAWVADWEFVGQRIVDPNPPLHDLYVTDIDGNEYTSMLVENPDYQYLIIAEDLERFNLKKIEQIQIFIQANMDNGIAIAVLTSSLPEVVEDFKNIHQLDIDFYYSDDIPLKSIIRSNPGLLLLKDANVIDKWHYNDWPEVNSK